MDFDKLFNWLSVPLGVLGGVFAGIMGEWDALLTALTALITLDYITGLAKAACQKQLSSNIGFKGLVKKIVTLILVAAANILQQLMGGSLPLREIVIFFFIANEGLSLLENAAVFVPIPAALKSALLQLREQKSGEGLPQHDVKKEEADEDQRD